MENGEPVLGATMVDLAQEKGAFRPEWKCDGADPGSHSIRFSFIGMESVDVTMEVFSDGDFRVEMSRR